MSPFVVNDVKLANPHHIAGIPARRVACLAVFCMATPAWSQTGILPVDVNNLNIRHRTPHYALAGTASDARLEEYGRCLEYIYREYADGFTELIEETPAGSATQKGDRRRDDDRFKVVIFDKQAEYNEFGAAYFGRGAEHTTGMFVGGVELLLICDARDVNETYGTLFHEAFHQFAAKYIPAAPMWLNEGLATYYGTARATRSGLVFDRPLSFFFRVVRDCASAGQLIPLSDLMGESRPSFYSGQPVKGTSHDHKTLAYAQSYTLIAYILSDSAGREHLREYLRELTKVKTDASALRVTQQSFPTSLLDAMVPKWLAKVNRGL